MSYHDIERKAEDAIAAVLATEAVTPLAGVTVCKGFAVEELPVPRCEVTAPESEPEVPGQGATGNYMVTMRVVITTSADDTTRLAHEAIVAGVRDVLFDDAASFVAAIALEEIAEFEAFDWTIGSTSRSVDAETRTRQTEIEGVLYCAPSQVTGD